MTAERTTLTRPEARELERLEEVIQEGLETFIEVGQALQRIKEERLYREDYDTWEQYVKQRWGMSYTYAYRHIRAADVAASLANWQGPVPKTEAQARPLARLDPDQRIQVWNTALEQSNGNPTAQDVQEATDRLTGSNSTGQAMDVHHSSESVEWYTPDHLLERVVDVLGQIDLDPCSNSRSDPVVPATEHFTPEQDGLGRKWWGKVYMNPPYGTEIGDWTEKLLSEYENGQVKEAIALLPARTDTSWFRAFRWYLICFLHGRLKFSKHQNAAPFPSACVYLGPQEDRFADVFGDIGDVFMRYG